MNIPRQRSFWAIAVGHTTVDIFTSMGPVLLAFLSAQVLPVSNTQIGAAVSAQQLAGSLSQPLFGWLADRGGARWQRWLGAGGVLWTVIFLVIAVALAMTGQYWLMVVPYALAALGSGAFHPVGTMLAAEADSDHAASNLSYFFLLGQAGLALGPALAGILLDRANPPGTGAVTVTPIYVLGLLALLPIGLLAINMPSGRARSRPAVAASPEATASLPVRALTLLALMVMLRSMAQPGSVAFIPRLFQSKGWDPTEYGLITTSFWLASGIAGVIFGQLADRYDRRHVIAGSLLLSVPALYLLPVSGEKFLAFGLAIAAGALTGGSHSVIVALAQTLIPGRKGLASGLTLGFLFATGAVGSLLIGGLADKIGLSSAFQIVALVMIAAGMTALWLPAGTQRHAAEARQPEPASTRTR